MGEAAVYWWEFPYSHLSWNLGFYTYLASMSVSLLLLWLQDMMKQSVNAKKAHSDLQQALDRMLKVLKNLNDSLHVVGLKGFPVSGRSTRRAV